MDHTFQVPGGANDAVLDLAVQADGRVVVVGEFTAFRGVALNRIARLNADGSLDGSFLPGTGMNSDVRDVVVDDSGRILAGGQFTQVAGTTQRYLARLTETGAVDPFFSMAVGFNNAVNALAIQPDGRILAAGAFTTVNQIGRARVVRLGTDASVDLTFDPGSGPSTTVLAVAAPANGNVLIGVSSRPWRVPPGVTWRDSTPIRARNRRRFAWRFAIPTMVYAWMCLPNVASTTRSFAPTTSASGTSG